jgi:hypothetical protein
MRNTWLSHASFVCPPLTHGLGALLDHPGAGRLGAWLVDLLGLIRVDGDVAGPELLTIRELRELPAVTQTVTYTAGGVPVTDTYTGPLLIDVIREAGGVVTDPAARNGILAHYVVIKGSDGYRVVCSFGEIDTRFGGEPITVAYDDTTGGLGWFGADGRAWMVVPGDAAGGRYVSDLVSLAVGQGPVIVTGPGGISTELTLGGAVASRCSASIRTWAAATRSGARSSAARLARSHRCRAAVHGAARA